MILKGLKLSVKTEAIDKKHWYLSDYACKNQTGIDEDLLTRTINQAEKYLQETIKTSETITVRSYQIFGIVIPLLTLAFGYFISNNQNEVFKLASLFASLILLTSGIFCILAMKPYHCHMIGSQPGDSLKEKIIRAKNPLHMLLVAECNNYQKRIKENAENNRLRATYIKRSILVLLFIPLSLFASWIGFLIA